MYRWRTLDDEDKREVPAWRERMERPSHSPPHIDSGPARYMITAACYNHRPHIGHSIQRMNAFAEDLLAVLRARSARVAAWVLLPNHYHALVSTGEVLELLNQLGRLHGRCAFRWNGEEEARSRQVWCTACETVMKSEAHYQASLNYLHHNPVKHGYTASWADWPWSSAAEWVQEMGREEAVRAWNAFPINRYGEGWDDAWM